MKTVEIHPSWRALVETYLDGEHGKKLRAFVHDAYRAHTTYPHPRNIFKALDLCSFEAVQVVILGQDPYHGAGQAHGLAFSVEHGVAVPPSLRNIYKEIESDLGVLKDNTGNLEHWAAQGVLLLNATLTVEAHKAGSHQGKGWEELTDNIVEAISNKKNNVVFLLWGNYARQKGKRIDSTKHLVLSAPHPSPLSAHTGFFGCKHFSQTNEYLKKHKKRVVEW